MRHNYEDQLNKTKYFLGNQINIVDIGIFPFIRQFANVDYKWFKSNYNKLSDWLEKISESELFIQVMEKHTIWDKKEKIYA